MTARQAARARTLALAGAALAVVLLGGCTSSFLGTGLADGPAEPDPQPSGTATAEPTAAPPVDARTSGSTR